MISLYTASSNVDPAINPHLSEINLEYSARELDVIIETSYQNEIAPLKAIELDSKIQESYRNEFSDDELSTLSYDILILVDEKFVKKKMKLEGKRNQKRELIKLAKAIARKHGISPNMFAALIKAESHFNPKTVSTKGAKGLCQIIPDNYKMLNITDPFDPIQNMEGGAKFFKMMFNRFNGNYKYALAAYNAGPGAVDEYNGVPPYQETIKYIEKVFNNFREYKKG
jgi:soluble lytic murein transglycosylase